MTGDDVFACLAVGSLVFASLFLAQIEIVVTIWQGLKAGIKLILGHNFDRRPASRTAPGSDAPVLVDACAGDRHRRHRDVTRHNHDRAHARVGAPRRRSLLQPRARRLLR